MKKNISELFFLWLHFVQENMGDIVSDAAVVVVVVVTNWLKNYLRKWNLKAIERDYWNVCYFCSLFSVQSAAFFISYVSSCTHYTLYSFPMCAATQQICSHRILDWYESKTWIYFILSTNDRIDDGRQLCNEMNVACASTIKCVECVRCSTRSSSFWILIFSVKELF